MSRYVQFLILLTFALRSLLPVGFMLSAAPGNGALQIVICTGHGPETIVVDEKGRPQPAKGSVDKTTCPYAPVGAAVANSDTPHVLSHAVRYAAVAYRIESQIFRARAKSEGQSARGPPSLI